MSETAPSESSVLFKVDISENYFKPGNANLFCMSLNHTRFAHGVQNASSEYVGVVSLIGPTNAGKSYIAKSFLNGADILPRVAERNQSQSTTAHVAVYKGFFNFQAEANAASNVNVLDFEGVGGGIPRAWIPDMGILRTLNYSVPGTIKTLTDELMKGERGHITSKLLPSVAYLLSDVLIHVDTTALHDSSRIDRIRELIEATHRTTLSVGWKPCLIIIHNKNIDIEEINEIDATLEPDLQWIHEGKLSDFFTRIWMIKIPVYNETRYHYNRDFHFSSLDVLHDVVKTAIAITHSSKLGNSCLYSEKKWWSLLPNFVDKIEEKNESQNQKTFILKSLNAVADEQLNWSMKQGTSFPLRLLNHSNFPDAMKTILDWRAYLYAESLRLSHDPVTLSDSALEDNFNTLLKCVIEQEQCQAVTTIDNKVYRCTQCKQGHEHHKNPEMVSAPSSNSFVRAITFGLWKDTKPCIWSGSFESTKLDERHTFASFNDRLKELNSLSIERFLTCFPFEGDKLTYNKQMCVLCLTTGEKLTLLKECRHQLCKNCSDRRTKLSPADTIVCPLCRSSNPLPRKYKSAVKVGFRVLTLDGGGVKGLIEICILQKIEDMFYPLKITSLFEVIVGTSIGGIIALNFLHGKKSLLEMKAFIEKMAKNIVDHNYYSGGFWNILGYPKCNTNALVDALKEYFGDEPLDDYNNGEPPFVFVTAFEQMEKQTYLLGNASALESTKLFPGIDDSLDVSLVDASRCTSSAPTFFKSHNFKYSLGETYFQKSFVDGGVDGANCPAEYAVKAATELSLPYKLELLVSIGTGAAAPKPTNQSIQQNDSMMHWADFFVDLALDSDRIWAKLTTGDFEKVRINPAGLGTLNPFSSASIEPLEVGIRNFFETTRDMQAMYHLIFAKMWVVEVVENLKLNVSVTMTIALRDYRFDFHELDKDDLEKVIKRWSPQPVIGANHEDLVQIAKKEFEKNPTSQSLPGKFVYTLDNSCDYDCDGRAVHVLIAAEGWVEFNVKWVPEDSAIAPIRISGFPKQLRVTK